MTPKFISNYMLYGAYKTIYWFWSGKREIKHTVIDVDRPMSGFYLDFDARLFSSLVRKFRNGIKVHR